jgi:hypothetical protein
MVRQDLSSEQVRPLSNTELDAVAGGLANPWLDWIADYFHYVKMDAVPEVIQC